jgi:O-antigen/teichoic acid export membrane protein
MNVNKMIFKEGALNLVALFISLCLNFLSTILLTKAFSVEEVGFFNAVFNASIIFSTITLAGIGNIFIRFIPGFDKNKESESSELFVFQLLKNIIVSILCIAFIYIFKTYFIRFFIKNEAIGTFFYIIPLYIVNTGFQQVLGNYLRAWYKTAAQSFIINTLLRSLNFLIIVLCLRFRLTMFSYLHYYMYLLVAINLILILAIFRNKFLVKVNLKSVLSKYLEREKLIEVDIYGLVMSISAIASILATYSDRILVNWFTDNSQLAIYNTAVLIGGTIAIFGNSLALIGHPLMGKYLKENNMLELDNIYKLTQKWSLIATLPVAVVFIAYSEPLLSLLGAAKGSEGSAYAAGAAVLSIVVVGQLINVGTGMCGGIISFSKYYKMDLYTQIILAALSIAFNIVFIPIYGMNGAAFATAASLAVYNIVKVLYVKAKFGILPFDKSILKVLLGTALTVCATVFFYRILNFEGFYLIIEVCIVTIVNYVIIVLSGLSEGDIGRLKKYILRK